MDLYFDKLCFEDQKKNEENEIIIKEEEFKKAFNQTFDYKKINDKISFEDNLDYNNKPTSMETPSTINEETSIKIKPGRKKKRNSSNFHDKSEKGNIRSKIKNKYHKFIIDFLNEQIRKINNGRQKVKFRTIDYNITNIRNKKENCNLLKIKIKDLLSNNISNKYGKPKEQNKKTLEKTYSELKSYYEMTYEYFYTNYFLMNNHPKEFSNKIDFFNDFVKKEKQKELNKIDKIHENNEEEKKKQKIRNENYINNLNYMGKNYISFYKNEKKNNFKNNKKENNIIFNISEM
jgi:hypothetical protein